MLGKRPACEGCRAQADRMGCRLTPTGRILPCDEKIAEVVMRDGTYESAVKLFKINRNDVYSAMKRLGLVDRRNSIKGGK